MILFTVFAFIPYNLYYWKGNLKDKVSHSLYRQQLISEIMGAKHIIVTWIERALNGVLKRAIKFWGLPFFFCAGLLFTKNYFMIYGYFLNIH